MFLYLLGYSIARAHVQAFLCAALAEGNNQVWQLVAQFATGETLHIYTGTKDTCQALHRQIISAPDNRAFALQDDGRLSPISFKDRKKSNDRA